MVAKTMTVHPFRGQAELVLRSLLSRPDKIASGRDLARSLGISQAWTNKILASLEANRLVQRNTQGPLSETRLVQPEKLLKRWTLEYRIDHNPHHFYFVRTENPLPQIRKISEKENFQYALTGYAAANLIEKTVYGDFPPMVYLWPNQGDDQAFEDILLKLENIYRFLPVKKHANLIVLQPVQKERVFFEAQKRKGTAIVSPLQLFLDLYSLDRGGFVIKELKNYWEEHGIPNEL